MNEELQSTNEELETVNEELRERSDELKRVNVFLESILASLRGGVVVVDAEFHVLIWNRKAEDLWGLRPDEVRGRNLLNLDIGLPVEQLKSALRGCLTGESRFQEAALPATNRRGKAVLCRVTCTPMTDDGVIKGVILVMDEDATARPAAIDGHGDGDGPPGRPGAGRRSRSAHGLASTKLDGDLQHSAHGLEGRATRSVSARGAGRRSTPAVRRDDRIRTRGASPR